MRFNSPYVPVVEGEPLSDESPDANAVEPLREWKKWVLLLGGAVFGLVIGINICIVGIVLSDDDKKLLVVSSTVGSGGCLTLSGWVNLKTCRILASQ